MAKAPPVQAEMPVVVTTEHKGVFFGYVPTGTKFEGVNSLRITKARLCVFWHESIKGFMGLASVGPNSKCRIGIQVPAITVNKVTAILEASAEAATAWEVAPWG